MALPRVKVVNPNESWRGTECYIDGNEIKNVMSVDFYVSVDEIPQFTFRTNGLPDIDMYGEVKFSFVPSTAKIASIVLRKEFRENHESMNALADSIESALKDAPEEIDSRDLALMIAKRIVGLEEK